MTTLKISPQTLPSQTPLLTAARCASHVAVALAVAGGVAVYAHEYKYEYADVYTHRYTHTHARTSVRPVVQGLRSEIFESIGIFITKKRTNCGIQPRIVALLLFVVVAGFDFSRTLKLARNKTFTVL